LYDARAVRDRSVLPFDPFCPAGFTQHHQPKWPCIEFRQGDFMKMLTQLKLVASLALVLCAASASADPMVYVVNLFQQFGTVNLATGAFSPIGPTIPEGSAGLVPGLGGSLLTLTISGNLASINPATGVTTVIGPTGLGGNANSLAEVGGTVYATDLNNNFYKVNTTTGAATLIGATGIPAVPAYPFTTNPDGSINLFDESLYGVGGDLYATFGAFELGDDGFTVTNTVDPNLYKIDPTSGVATLVSSTADHILSTVDVNGTLYAFQGTISSTYNFFDPGPLIQVVTLDVTNGNTSVVTDLDPAAGAIFGASPVPTPEPASLALVGTGLAVLASQIRRHWGRESAAA
jgi:hypothetical protein